jgi:hypothetical protein
MANRETSGLGGGGVVVCPKVPIAYVLTSVLKECGVMAKGECLFSYVTRVHFL